MVEKVSRRLKFKVFWGFELIDEEVVGCCRGKEVG